MFVELRPEFGWRDPASVAEQQIDAKFVLEVAHLLAERGWAMRRTSAARETFPLSAICAKYRS